MNQAKNTTTYNANRNHKKNVTPCVKTLFEIEQSHYPTKLEEALPSESELQYLMARITENTDRNALPDDTGFYNELRDRLCYNFREALLSWLDGRPKTTNCTRQHFINLNGGRIAKNTLEAVKGEYQALGYARSYWGEKVGYFS
ncbi:hypothetical protein MSP8887_00469 [Marinomonas spartinae]|uniref:Uncharacterized protein n=1 Tax=Marinomonas spartinae TaxID=1792290 RepID=A0A1A8TI07_9GAMM|nr:hypothetical protein [Marinomonas spartinae]SBS26686.1 hypothetical protein MSP8887_00469 [Marinomonas spartinae]SBS32928.1 hypothetical protein MSP8886_02596 [Marinomonas spartinae]